MYNVLSLGAGVQSSCLAFMAEKGEVTPKPDFAVFADTQAEPQQVYDYLEYLKDNVSFPVHVCTAGNLEKEAIVTRKATANAKLYSEGEEYNIIQIPIFGRMPSGKITAALGRTCTRDFKIRPIQRKIKEVTNLNTYTKAAKGAVTTWIGISLDEITRMKPSQLKWIVNRHPLIELEMTRDDCINWLKKNNYKEPVRSACYFCPFHSKDDWTYLKEKHPKEFDKAVKFDNDIRNKTKLHKNTKMEVYLHKSCKPLNEIDFSKEKEDYNFNNECEGMCGL